MGSHSANNFPNVLCWVMGGSFSASNGEMIGSLILPPPQHIDFTGIFTVLSVLLRVDGIIVG